MNAPHSSRRGAFAILLTMLAWTACAPQRASDAELVRTMRETAETLMGAMRGSDYDTQVGLAHPGLIAGVGGAAKYREMIERVASQVTGDVKPALTDRAEVFVAGDRAFGRVHFEMELTRRDGKKAKISAYMIGEAPVDGSAWRFIDGTGLRGDRAKLAKVIDGFPEQLELPMPEAPIWR